MSRKVTYRGRVVYERARHPFRLSDAARIHDAIFRGALGNLSALQQIVLSLSLRMLGSLLAIVGAERFVDVVYFYLTGTVAWVLGQLGVDGQLKLSEGIIERISFVPEGRRAIIEAKSSIV